MIEVSIKPNILYSNSVQEWLKDIHYRYNEPMYKIILETEDVKSYYVICSIVFHNDDDAVMFKLKYNL